jgi:hypothetical protein
LLHHGAQFGIAGSVTVDMGQGAPPGRKPMCVARCGRHAAVDQTDARNAKSRFAVGVSDRRAHGWGLAVLAGGD